MHQHTRLFNHTANHCPPARPHTHTHTNEHAAVCVLFKTVDYEEKKKTPRQSRARGSRRVASSASSSASPSASPSASTSSCGRTACDPCMERTDHTDRAMLEKRPACMCAFRGGCLCECVRVCVCENEYILVFW